MHRRKVTVTEQIEAAKGCIEGSVSQTEAVQIVLGSFLLELFGEPPTT